MKILLRGMGQIMLQNSAVVGAFFLLGIFVASPTMGLGAVLGLLVGTTVAKLWKYPHLEIEQGLYGFNGALVGIALLFLFKISILLFLWIVPVSMFATFLMRTMLWLKLRPFTFPFVLATWVAIILMNNSNLFTLNVHAAIPRNFVSYFSGISMGFGQVMFQASVISGILFFLGIMFHSRRSAAWGVVGSIVGLATGLVLGAPAELLTLGIFGYNATLAAIAFAHDTRFRFLSVLIASILSAVLLNGFIGLNIVALTAPFVFATWLTMLIQLIYIKTVHERRDTKTF